MPSGHSSGNIYDPDGISPTIMFHHGYPALILEECDNMNSRLKKMLEDGIIAPFDGLWIDTYNKGVNADVAGTIRTNSSNMHYVMEQIPFNTTVEGLAYTITTRYGAMCAHNLSGGDFPMTAVLSIKTVTENMKPQTDSRDKTSAKVPNELNYNTCAMRGRGERGNYHQELFIGGDVAHALTTVQKDSMVCEDVCPSIISVQPWSSPRGNMSDVAPSLTSSAWEQNNFVKTSTNSPLSVPSFTHTDDASKGLDSKVHFRIRKLTPRECYRLMDVPEQCIDRLLASDIAKSQHYKLAGNSIVVSCLYYIFKSLFTNEIPTNQQLALF